MRLYIVTCLCLALGCQGIVARPLDDQRKPILLMEDKEGLSAERWLIDGAELIQYLPPRVIIYRRHGGLDAAVHDFYALKPSKVEKWNLIDGIELKGMIGKHQLILNSNPSRYPYISITRFEPGKDPEYNFYMKVFAYMDDFQETKESFLNM